MIDDYTYYLFDKNSKEGIEFIDLIYIFCYDNHLISKSNKYIVIAHSVMEITQALKNVTKYKLKFDNKKYRTWCNYKEQALHTTSNKNIIHVKIPGYINDENDKINLKEYKKVIKCIDNSWGLNMYKNNNERKNALEDADVYLLSGTYLMGGSCSDFKGLGIKLSVAFFTDEKLADLVQKDINHISAGLSYKDITEFKKHILNSHEILNLYKKNYTKITQDINNIKTVVKEYNNSNEDNKNIKVVLKVEPSRKYAYITSKHKKNIKKFSIHYNGLDPKYELNKSKTNMIWNPNVLENGMFIQFD